MMSAADEAYAHAVKKITKAKTSGAKNLSFDFKVTQALTHLPPEITQLHDLRNLNLNNTQITNIKPLTMLTGLNTLSACNTQITDFAPLAAIKGLSWLYLKNAYITNLAPLVSLINLIGLFLDGSMITDLVPLAKMTGLRTLSLSNTEITDTAPIAALRQLKTLYLHNTQITDLAPLAALSRLSTLHLQNTQVADFSPLAALTELSWLDLKNTKTTDFAFLRALTRLSGLFLDSTKIIDLTPLAALTRLRALTLNDTHITSLAPLTALTRLSMVDLSTSSAFDLRALLPLTLLAKRPELFGLQFKNTAATRADPRIAEIAEIEDNTIRARELFDYLKDWVPPDEVKAPPKPDPIFETVIIDGKLELLSNLPSQEEQVEPLKRHIHQRLQTAVPDLARAAGNQFPRLAAKARILAGLVEKPFEQLDMISIHLEVEVLQERLNAGTEEGVIFPDEVRGPLSDVTRVGPGLTVGNAMVDLFMERVRQTREHPAPAEEQAAHADLSAKIVADPAANGPNSIAMETLIATLKDIDARQAAQKPKHQWLLYSLTALGAASSWATVAPYFGPAINAFIANNAPSLIAVALTYGAPFALWFGAVMGPIFLALGVEEAVVKRLKK